MTDLQNISASEGEEIIIRFRELDPLPSNAPFAPSKEDKGQIVLKVAKILTEGQSGNFSLGISQVVPMNVFINLIDLDKGGSKSKANRLLIDNAMEYPVDTIAAVISELLTIDDIGLSIAIKSGEPELISTNLVDMLLYHGLRRSGPPLITYLANSMRSR
jgi:hypothetical protein